MKLPYSNATSGHKAREEVSKLLQNFGCDSVGFMDDYAKKELILCFVHRGRNIQLTASAKGWAALYLKENPYSSRRTGSRQQYEEKAINQGLIAINSIIRDWVKGSIMAVETGIMSFDHVFLSHIMLTDGRTVLEHAQDKKLLLPAQEIDE